MSEETRFSARDRLTHLFDADSFIEIDRFVTHHVSGFGLDEKIAFGDSVVTGFGRIHGRNAFAYAQDASFLGGSLGEAHAKKICKIMDLASREMCPIIGFNDSGGARLQEGVVSLAGYGEIFLRNVRLSGVVPQISCINGFCAGGAVYSPAVTDFIFMVEDQGYMFITGPKVIKAVTGEQITKEDLGSSRVHASRTGLCHRVARDDRHAAELIRHLLSFLPSNSGEKPPSVDPTDDPNRPCPRLNDLVPKDPRSAYNVVEIIDEIVDRESFFELHPTYGRNLITGFARLNGHPVGMVASQPAHLAGSLDTDAARKGARFIRTCDAFNIPLITFLDVSGFLPGVDQEHQGIIIQGAKLLFAYAEASVPKISVILRKAFGGAYIVMSSKHVGGDFNFAWPTAQIAVMGPEGALEILHQKKLKLLKEQGDEEGLRRLTAELTSEYSAAFMNPNMAAEHGFIDDVIAPEATRQVLIHALSAVSKKREMMWPHRHRNTPL